MPSDLDAVIEEFTVEDAELVVETLRDVAKEWDDTFDPEAPELARRCRLIANHLAIEAGKVRMKTNRANDVTCFDPVAEAEARHK